MNSDLFPYLEYRAPMGLFSGKYEVPPIIAGAELRPLTGRLTGFSDIGLVESFRKRGVMLHRLLNHLDSADADGYTKNYFDQLEKSFVDLIGENDPWLTTQASIHLKTYSGSGVEPERWKLFFQKVLTVSRDPALREAYRILGGNSEHD